MELVKVQNTQDKSPELASKFVQALMLGNLSTLNAIEKADYYGRVCESVGLNPLTTPFQYMSLNGKEILYAGKNCCEQLRSIHHISIQIVSREIIDGVLFVTARAIMPDGREDESIGAVCLGSYKLEKDGKSTFVPLTGEMRANMCMKAETKSKRRVTLSICGLGMLDETEVNDIESKHKVLPKDRQIDVIAIVESIDKCNSLDELKTAWSEINEAIRGLPHKEKDPIVMHKEKRKEFLYEAEKNKTVIASDAP